MMAILYLPQIFAANGIIVNSASAYEATTFIKVSRGKIIFKHPQEYILETELIQAVYHRLQQWFSIAFADVFRQKIDGNDFAVTAHLRKSGRRVSGSSDETVIFDSNNRVASGCVDLLYPSACLYAVQIVLWNHATVGVFPAFLIDTADLKPVIGLGYFTDYHRRFSNHLNVMPALF